MDSRGPGLEKGINSHRSAGGGELGEGGRLCPSPTQFLKDQLTLFQPGGRLCPPHYCQAPPQPPNGTASLIELGMSPHTQTGPVELGSKG